jgi:hypothetical protein
MRTKPWQKWCDVENPENEKLPLGEGQEDNALNSLSKVAVEGGWVIIQICI